MTTQTGWIVRLDPTSELPDRVELDLNFGPLRVDHQGIDWGDAAITAFLADMQIGSAPTDYRIPNRIVTLPLFIGADDISDPEVARQQLEVKVGLLQREGGVLLRQRDGGDPLYADIVDATLNVPDAWSETGDVEASVTLTLECLPDFYGDAIDLDAIAGLTGASATVLESAGQPAVIEGHYPGRVQVTVTDESGNDQHSLLWGFRSRYYDPAAPLILDAADLNPASNSTVVSGSIQSTFQPPFWVPMLDATLEEFGYTHRGSYAVWVRASSERLTPTSQQPQLRLAWQVGSGAATINAPVEIPPNQPFLLPLGPIRLDAPPQTPYGWSFQLQKLGTTDWGHGGTETLVIYEMYLVPIDDTSGQLIYSPSSIALSDLTVYDALNAAPGALAGSAAQIGGSWSTSGSSAGDFDFAAAEDFASYAEWLTRSGQDGTGDLSSSGFNDINGGRFAVIGSAIGDSDARVSIFERVSSPATEECKQAGGLLLRFQDSNNFVCVRLTALATASGTTWWLEAHMMSGGTHTLLGKWPLDANGQPASPATSQPPQQPQGGFPDVPPIDAWVCGTLRATIDHAGNLRIYWAGGEITIDTSTNAYSSVGNPAGEPQLLATLNHSALASTGALATGKLGLYDLNAIQLAAVPPTFTATSPARAFNGFVGYSSTHDAVIYGHQSMVLRWDGVNRQASDGDSYAPVQLIGDLPRIPPSGLEARECEMFLRPSRGDLDTEPDAALDSYNVAVSYRPCYLGRI